MTPAIGETVTTERARALCLEHDLPHLAARIDATPEAFKPWVFDGVSVLREKHAAFLLNLTEDEVTADALPHDLEWAYGEPGNAQEKRGADRRLLIRFLSHEGVNEEAAIACWRAVRLGEFHGTSFGWGFARR